MTSNPSILWACLRMGECHRGEPESAPGRAYVERGYPIRALAFSGCALTVDAGTWVSIRRDISIITTIIAALLGGLATGLGIGIGLPLGRIASRLIMERQTKPLPVVRPASRPR